MPNAVPERDGLKGLQPLGVTGQAAHLSLVPPAQRDRADASTAPTSVSLFDQGLLQVLQASVSGLEPRRPYLLALAHQPDGSGPLEPLAFTTNPAGSAIVNTLGPIRQIVDGDEKEQRRYLVIAPGSADDHGIPIQVQAN